MNGSCKNCRYWVAPAKEGQAGNCKKNPPQCAPVPVQTLQGTAIGWQSMFPPTQPDEWCGEFQPRIIQ